MKIDIDEELAARPMTRREKLALYILLTAFWMILPAKYSHQVEASLGDYPLPALISASCNWLSILPESNISSTMPGCLLENSKTNSQVDDIKHIDEETDAVAPYVLIFALSVYAVLILVKLLFLKK